MELRKVLQRLKLWTPTNRDASEAQQQRESMLKTNRKTTTNEKPYVVWCRELKTLTFHVSDYWRTTTMALRSDDRRKSIQTIFGTKIKMLEISSRHSVWKSQNKSHYKKSYILSVKKGSFWRVFFNLNFYFRPFLSLVSVSLMLLKACCCNVRSDDDSVSPTIF